MKPRKPVLRGKVERRTLPRVLSSVQLLCHVQLFVTPQTAAHQSSLSITNSWSLLKHVHQVGDVIQPSHPLLSPSPPSFYLSQRQGLFHESVLHIRWPKYWSFSFSISLSNEYSGLIAFGMECLDLLTVQGTLKSLVNHSSVQFISVTQSCPTLCDPMNHSTPGLPVHHQSQSLLKLMSIQSAMSSNHLILCCPLLLPPSIFPSIRVFSSELFLHIRWPKYWSLSFISPSKEIPGLISFRMDWLDLLAVQGTLKSLLQQHSSKVSLLWR